MNSTNRCRMRDDPAITVAASGQCWPPSPSNDNGWLLDTTSLQSLYSIMNDFLAIVDRLRFDSPKTAPNFCGIPIGTLQPQLLEAVATSAGGAINNIQKSNWFSSLLAKENNHTGTGCWEVCNCLSFVWAIPTQNNFLAMVQNLRSAHTIQGT